MKKIIILFFVLMAISFFQDASAVSLGDIIQGIKDRTIYANSYRFTDSLFKRLINDEQEDLAIAGRCIEACTTITISDTSVEYSQPSNFYLFRSAKLYPDPLLSQGPDNPAYMLKYVPFEDYGSGYSFETGRPEQVSVANQKFYFNKMSATGIDTVEVCYFAHAVDMADDTSTMSIPRQYKSLLIDRVIIRVYEKLNFVPPDKTVIDNRITEMEKILFERPVDER